MIYETIHPLLAPVVLISACGLMIMSLNARTLKSQSRLRRLQHERLEIAELVKNQVKLHQRSVTAMKVWGIRRSTCFVGYT